MSDETPFVPPEWEAHDAVWSAWPSHAALWQNDLEPARMEIAAFFRAIDADGSGELINVLVADEAARKSAQEILSGLNVNIIDMPFGDIWLRDTGPLFAFEGETLVAKSFGFNGWGGKYQLHGDSDVSRLVALKSKTKLQRLDPILEGGAIDFDGTGRVLTTEDCVLNKNRNVNPSKEKFERFAAEVLGLTDVIWLKEGLAGDHTDGHVDNLARFYAPGKVITMRASTADDPNAGTYESAGHLMEEAGIEVARVPSPGRLENADGEVIPASYMNFFIANKAVIVPVYNQPSDDEAVEGISALFPDRKVVGLPAIHLLTGGGSFHCITQQQPKQPGSGA